MVAPCGNPKTRPARSDDFVPLPLSKPKKVERIPGGNEGSAFSFSDDRGTAWQNSESINGEHNNEIRRKFRIGLVRNRSRFALRRAARSVGAVKAPDSPAESLCQQYGK